MGLSEVGDFPCSIQELGVVTWCRVEILGFIFM